MQYITGDSPLEVLRLSVRSFNALKKFGVKNVGQLFAIPIEKLFDIPNLGKKSVAEIQEVLKDIKEGKNGILFVADGDELQEQQEPKKEQVNDVNLFYDRTGILREDIPIKDLDFSVRAFNCLRNSGICFASEILELSVEDLFAIKNMGKKTVQEILDKREDLNFRAAVPDNNGKGERLIAHKITAVFINEIRTRINANPAVLRKVLKQPIENYVSKHSKEQGKTVQDFLCDPLLIKLLYSQDLLRKIVKNHIILELQKETFGMSYAALESKLPEHLKETNIFRDLLHEIYIQGEIIFTESGVERKYPTVLDYALSISDERGRAILVGRLYGEALEKLGRKFGISRERVRQIERKLLKKRPRLMEDKYAEVFQKYHFKKEDFMATFEEPEITFNYLNLAYSKGKAPIEELMSDSYFPISFRKGAEKVLFKDYITIKGERVKLTKSGITYYVLKTFVKDETSFEDFVSIYKSFLREHNLDSNEKLRFDEQTLQNQLADADYVLWKRKKRLRYYDISEYDFSELLQALAFEQYSNVEYSTLKFFRDFPQVMRLYDIRNEYELHNLLKKLYRKIKNGCISFKRMPTIEFGEANRDMQVLDLLLKHAPVSIDDLAKAYEQEYGVRAETVKANYLRNFDKYYFNGMYSIEVEPLPAHESQRLKAILTGDFYSITDIKEVYCREFPDSSSDLINPFSIKMLGFRVYSSYAIKNSYNTATEYFRKVLTEQDKFDLRKFPKAMTQLVTFTTELMELRNQYEIIEYSPSQHVNIRSLEKRGITKDHLRDYCNAVFSAAERDSYFTVHSLRKKGFSHLLDDLGFEEWFYGSILSQDSRFSYQRAGKNRIFLKGGRQVLLKDFIYMIVRLRQSINLTSLLQLIEDDYGVTIPRHKVMAVIRSSSMYYNEVTEKVYADYYTYSRESLKGPFFQQLQFWGRKN
ncbi:MAG TPA: hypothetical protein GX691_01580 [Clostridia bacterium]|nr:hypothetical protein [Clostridia bacterium]